MIVLAILAIPCVAWVLFDLARGIWSGVREIIATRAGSTMRSCDEARELAKRLHESAAWHCGCSACAAWRRHCGGAS